MPAGWYNLDAAPGMPGDMLFGGEKGAFEWFEFTRYQRMLAFGACYLGGFAISILGAVLLLIGQGSAFAILFGLGAIISLAGTGFLIGFKRQFELMFKPVRIAATILMFAAIAMCFVSAFLLPDVLCIIFVIIEYLCMLWYSLSYVPYARATVKNAVSKVF